MNITEIVQALSLIVAPVVIISCCILFLNGQLQRYDGISARMRSMNLERFELLREAGITDLNDRALLEDGILELRVREIEDQLPHLLKRHKMIHRAALTLGFAIMIFVVSMFALALAALLHATLIGILALVIFLAGMGTILLGGTLIMRELYLSHRSVNYEVRHALSFGKQFPPLTLPHKSIRMTRQNGHKKTGKLSSVAARQG